MARDPFPWFTYKSKAQQKKEQKAYAAWAFPYGEAQKEKLQELLGQLVPKEDKRMAMVAFLTGKEGFQARDEDEPDIGRDPLEDAIRAILGSGIRTARRDLPLYLALIQADARVDGRSAYPTVEELRAAAERLEL